MHDTSRNGGRQVQQLLLRLDRLVGFGRGAGGLRARELFVELLDAALAEGWEGGVIVFEFGEEGIFVDGGGVFAGGFVDEGGYCGVD